MHLTVNLHSESYRRLVDLAKRRGRSVEECAVELLEEVIPTATPPAFDIERWGYKGRRWDTIPADERARIELENYKGRPYEHDEFPVHPDDELGADQDDF